MHATYSDAFLPDRIEHFSANGFIFATSTCPDFPLYRIDRAVAQFSNLGETVYIYDIIYVTITATVGPY
jgi:hypothetical protein